MGNRQGNLHFLGRFDTQVKINVDRIELSEIEDVLQTYPNDQSIVVHIRPMQPSERDIRRSLSERLTKSMLPSFVLPVDSIP
jgi:acyl-CoA synthetase (AMP-forming)/AMP-acid ligase II